jgi:hypothetical protein
LPNFARIVYRRSILQSFFCSLCVLQMFQMLRLWMRLRLLAAFGKGYPKGVLFANAFVYPVVVGV